MNDLQIFKNEEFGDIRTVEIDGEIWFVGRDIANALGYSNTSDAIKTHVDDEDKRMGSENATPYITDTLGRKQYPLYINESGLYALVLGSGLINAKKFKRWVTSEVLPSIRKTGGYNLPQTYSEALRALADKAEEAERLAIENQEMRPKAEYFDALVDRKLNTSFRDTAKELNVGERAFIGWLQANRYIYRDQKKQLRPYADKNKGLFEVKEYTSRNSDHAGLQTLITPKGRETFRLLICGEV